MTVFIDKCQVRNLLFELKEEAEAKHKEAVASGAVTVTANLSGQIEAYNNMIEKLEEMV